ncbi:MAG: hypothetical protein ABFD97_03610 [Syntrophobacter sp.]
MNILKHRKLVLFMLMLSLTACGGMSPAHQAVINERSSTVDIDMPVFENRLETDHFVLKWTGKSSHSGDNIYDSAIIKDTADYLETAWGKYTSLFGRQPYMAPGRDKIDVVFRDIDCYGLADPPDGPIQFNSQAWVKKPGIRQPTSAHELFHKMQYAYGYKTKWNPKKPFLWFTEGTAAWSEVFVWGKVSRACKVDEIFRDTRLDLYEAEDMAMPFWIFFVAGNHEHANDSLMVRLFEKCEQLGDIRHALDQVINENYGRADAFFSSFSSARKNGFFADRCRLPYKCILGPDGKDVVDKVKCLQKKPS